MRNERQFREKPFFPFVHEKLSHVLFCGEFFYFQRKTTLCGKNVYKSTNFFAFPNICDCPMGRKCLGIDEVIGCNLKGSHSNTKRATLRGGEWIIEVISW